MRRRFFNNNIENFDINDYLTIEALEDNLQVNFPYEDLMYGIDGLGWQKLRAGEYAPALNKGQTISFKGNVRSTITNRKSFTITKRCNLLGNCMSLTLDDIPHFIGLFLNCQTIVSVSKDFLPATALVASCYENMFSGCTSLATAPELPATKLEMHCYADMFAGCSSLVNAPALPATTLAQYCYISMFSNCTSLTASPELPAMTLSDYCYYDMFNGCTALTTAPALPATTLADSCYNGMFRGCTSLTTAPVLPATTLTNYCYASMFDRCASLVNAPALPATTLVSNCYKYMFQNCTKLNYIKMLATNISASYCLSYWLSNVASTGTFVKNPAMNNLPTGTSGNNYAGIPSGWTVINDGEE